MYDCISHLHQAVGRDKVLRIIEIFNGIDELLQLSTRR